MTKKEFRKICSQRKFFLDGATGSNLQKAGMPVGVCPEEWILENPEVLINLQKDYFLAGADAVYAPTFSGNSIKLDEYGLKDKLRQMNIQLVELSKTAAKEAMKAMMSDKNAAGDIPEKLYVIGDMTMTGKQVEPMGNLSFDNLVDVYKEQIEALEEAGVDMLVIETMMSLQECRAAVIAAKEITSLPVLVTLSFNEDGRTLYGTSPETAALVLSTLGVDAVGVNCSTGPDKLIGIVEKMKRYADIPIIAKPNAGLPQLINGITEYDMDDKTFGEEMVRLSEAGADILGGCCGTTPKHISCLVNNIKKSGELNKPDFLSESRIKGIKRRALSNERTTLDIPLDGDFLVIGERINPTGKKALQEELKEGVLDLVTEFAESQEDGGAAILDVNMGMNGIDEKQMMLKAVKELSIVSNLPLSIDSSYVDVVEAALRIYPGRALINSISLEPEKFEKLIPIAKKFGAMFILLPLSDKGLPKDLNEKKYIIDTIHHAAIKAGLRDEDIVVDGLVATIGANKNAAKETLETIRYCKEEKKLATVCGLSNISFGLPERQFINSTFMALAIGQGLTMAIANPSQHLLMHAVYAADLLMNKPDGDLRYINRVSDIKLSVIEGDADIAVVRKTSENTAATKGIPDEYADDVLFEAVVKGRKNKIINLLDDIAVVDKERAKDIIDKSFIPAINYVGDLFEKQIYFLPQLIASAETMEKGIKHIEPLLASGDDVDVKGVIVIATVEHDIHDIGKNLVALMLKNYGYKVIDLGKDVPAEKIIETAQKENADIIALSALMTTTMMEMKKVVNLVREKGMNTKVMIGGAVITKGFADEIGAEGYSKDAGEACKVAAGLIGDNSKMEDLIQI